MNENRRIGADRRSWPCLPANERPRSCHSWQRSSPSRRASSPRPRPPPATRSCRPSTARRSARASSRPRASRPARRRRRSSRPTAGARPRQGPEQRHAGGDRATSASGRCASAGFNVLTWDSRGFGESGGTVEVDSKDFEGRDVSALLDWLADAARGAARRRRRPARGHDGAPTRAGSSSSRPAIDRRIDAIAPDIAWHSLLTALYTDDIVKGGWARRSRRSASRPRRRSA